MKQKAKYYVYLIRDPRPGKNNVPMYVGKGRGYRFSRDRERSKYNKLLASVSRKCWNLGLKLKHEIVCYFDNEADAFRFEVELIAKYGRRDLGKGMLCNQTNGGEGTSGSLATSENMKRLHADAVFAERQRKGAADHLRRLQADPVYAQGRNERLRLLNADSAFKQKQREATQLHHADPIFIKSATERLRKLHTDPVFVEKLREGRRKLHADPVYAKARDKRLQKLNDDPVFKEARRDFMRRLNADPAFKEALRERARKRNRDPIAIAKRVTKQRAQRSRGQLTFEFGSVP